MPHTSAKLSRALRTYLGPVMLSSRLAHLAVFTLLVFGLTAGTAVGQSEMTRGTGLESDGEVRVVVENLGADGKEIGLSKEAIQNRTELRLRRSGIDVVDGKSGPYLYVNIQVTGDAFDVDISFNRITYYQVEGKMYRTSSETWSDGGTGTTPKGDENYVMDSLDQILDYFLNEYLAANE